MYVIDHDRQISLISEMTQLRKDSESWEVYYHHPTTNAMWKSYFPKANGKKRGPKILRTEPVPDRLEDRFENCLVEPETENAIGLGIELSTTPGIWQAVIEILENNYRRYDRKQLKLFLKQLGVENYDTKLDEINGDVKDLDLTEEELKKMSRRAKIIRFKRFWSFS
jgi:hypothetical protein